MTLKSINLAKEVKVVIQALSPEMKKECFKAVQHLKALEKSSHAAVPLLASILFMAESPITDEDINLLLEQAANGGGQGDEKPEPPKQTETAS